MNLPILWTDEAMDDLDELFTKILEKSPQNALLVDDRIKNQVELLSRFPFLGHRGRARKPEPTREILVPKTSYIVSYRVDDKTVRILRVLHAARDWPEEMS